MYKIVLWLGSIWVLGACASKEEKLFLEHHTQEGSYHQKLQKTESIIFKKQGTTQLTINATYLYPNNITANEEVFVVGMMMDESLDLGQKDFVLALEGQGTRSIIHLKQESSLLKDIPFQSKWHRFYRVSFPYSEKKYLNFTFSHPQIGTGKMSFSKGAKYMLNVSGF